MAKDKYYDELVEVVMPVRSSEKFRSEVMVSVVVLNMDIVLYFR